jgi:hypothetical protein
MKKNAILLAGIMFVAAGCAHQAGYNRAGSDSASDVHMSMENYRATEETPDRHPDGSLSTPASTALQSDPASYSAGASLSDAAGSSEITSNDTIRAEGIEAYSSAETSALITDAEAERDDFGQGSSATFESDKAGGSVRASANWNPSDDLLPDGPLNEDEMNNDASIGGAASSESGSRSSNDVSGDLNASEQLEENISGEFSLPENSETSATENSDSFDTSRVPESQVGATTNEGEPRFQNNRARGVGSAATGEFGVAHSRNPLSDVQSNDLAERVKAQLTRESTGTHGLMRHQVARNIEVTAQNGEVTLKGSVPSERDRKMIEARAAEISGVKRVHNQITVNPSAEPANRNLGIGHDLEDRTSELQER